MDSCHRGPPPPGRVQVGGVPAGHDSGLLLELAVQTDGPVLHIARDDRRLAETLEGVAFRGPGFPVLEFPAWDCQPYDRVSANPEIAARRTLALTRLAGARPGPMLVLTSVNASLQRVPPRRHMAASSWAAKTGDAVDLGNLTELLERTGYLRVPMVGGPGEYAVRGSLVDVFGPGMEHPLRLEFAWDRLETVRRFHPSDQRTIGAEDSVELVPAGEVPLDRDAMARFRQCYLQEFGVPGGDDPLYEAIAAGHRTQGMEHWLPFFFERLETIFDYLPEAPVALDALAGNGAEERLETVARNYAARRELGTESGRSAVAYRPCPPEQLYLGLEEWHGCMQERAVREFLPGRPPSGGNATDAGARVGRDFAVERTARDTDLFAEVARHLRALRAANKGVLLAAVSEGSRDRIGQRVAEAGCPLRPVRNWQEFEAERDAVPPPAMLAVWRLEAGYETEHYAVVAEADVFGERLAARSARTRRPQDYIKTVADLAPGDLVVHVEFGLGRFRGLDTIGAGGTTRECVTLEYAGGDLLRVPVENVDLLYRYGESESASLDRLGASGWQARQARARKRVREIAADLIRTAALRALRRAPAIDLPEDGYAEFCARFPYTETEGQVIAVSETLADLASGRAMDRLICGDVGFGKTEVALRAAFAVAMSGGQVALLAPTTLLVRQHYRTFCERFKGFPVEVRSLSRFSSAADAARVRAEIQDGSAAIVIGTHALLSKAVGFADLRLAIIDEEQQFGVEQKERLKALRADAHVLAMSATPIPRTLQLALSGVRPMSVIVTPPADRLAVRAYAVPFDPQLVREALLREHARGGQSFFVVPRIRDLDLSEGFLRDAVPEVRFAVAHGQMPVAELEQRMNAFYDGAYDVLLSTSIIASGLDIPRANTVIIRKADRFGLAQLYQIRGRVGRSRIRAYVYFTTESGQRVTEAAGRRLEAAAMMEELGAGFALANRDLDIRGAGNLLGAEQAGHIREVGAELYQEMLASAVRKLRSEKGEEVEEEETWSPRIEIGLPAAIPQSYIPDLAARVTLYRRLAGLQDSDSIESLAVEMHDRFGAPPPEVDALCQILQLKAACRRAGIASIEIGEKGARVAFRPRAITNPQRLVEYVASKSGDVRLRPDGTLVLPGEGGPPQMRVPRALAICGEVAEIAGMA